METAIIKPFADGEYRFWLPMPSVIAADRELGLAGERRTSGSGAPRCLLALFYDLGGALGTSLGQTILTGPAAATVEECQIVIRNALSGGGEGRVGEDDIGVAHTLAQDLVQTYCYPARPAVYDLELCYRILEAAFYGVKLPEPAKKKPTTPAAKRPSQRAPS